MNCQYLDRKNISNLIILGLKTLIRNLHVILSNVTFLPQTATPDSERTVPMRENTYVRVFGHVRAFGGKRNLAAFRLYQLVDMNELTTHLLEVVHCHLKVTKTQPAVRDLS